MDNLYMPYSEEYSRIRSARNRKRNVIRQKHKNYIKLYKERNRLADEIHSILPKALEKPYQKGWVRSFVLRGDQWQTPLAGFYHTLLSKINTVHYSMDKHFRKPEKRRRKHVYTIAEQQLKVIGSWQWQQNVYKLSEREKACFRPALPTQKHPYIHYVFAEPWRFVLKVKPNMITHILPKNAELESAMARVKNYITRHNLQGTLNRLRGGGRSRYTRKPQPDPLRNKPRHLIEEVYRNQ